MKKFFESTLTHTASGHVFSLNFFRVFKYKTVLVFLIHIISDQAAGVENSDSIHLNKIDIQQVILVEPT